MPCAILPVVTDRPPTRQVSAFYWATIGKFLTTEPTFILGVLSAANPFVLNEQQRDAWQEEVSILQSALDGLPGSIFIEFDVPRLGSRIDAVVVSGPAIFPIEFKCGESVFRQSDYNQAWDYALDLKNFHGASHCAPIFPILLATAARRGDPAWLPAHADRVRPPLRCGAGDLKRGIHSGLATAEGDALDSLAWGAAPYSPTPTIIEAARALYARHTVEAISRNDAGAKNLQVTSGAVEEIIEQTRNKKRKAIIFLTGVPGAGKTLVGLNVATKRRALGDARAVFLSGNGPLVAVLREALTRDEMARRGKGVRKGTIRQEVKPFIQNVHHFRDAGVRDPSPPDDHVVIFDEAQRAWDERKTCDFMKRRKRIPNFTQSEPTFLTSYLNRHEDWAVVVCLVGGGQEIHDGEAGIGEWLETIRTRFRDWIIHVSPGLGGSEYSAAASLAAFGERWRLITDERLHLSTSMRSFRSERVSEFVRAVLDCDAPTARALLAEVAARYPMAITRDLERAKRWVRGHARGSERYGLVASSKAFRLKPHAVDVRVDVDPIHYFLGSENDTRSSYYLEDPATEFQIQGLELDWTCVTWDADLRRAAEGWHHMRFRGDRWVNMGTGGSRQQYHLNAYRVLLTRARQGMVIFVPPGDASDLTRDPSYYDRTYEYLAGIGLPEA